jgi:hypothetical protein
MNATSAGRPGQRLGQHRAELAKVNSVAMPNVLKVFEEIMRIAHSSASPAEQRAEAEELIDQFKTDLLNLRAQHGTAYDMRDRLRKRLLDVAKNPGVPNEETNVFMYAFERLTGEQA